MIKKLIVFSILLTLLSCKASVNPNEWVVSTATCWNTMTVSKAGDAIPRLLSTCDRMVILPATEMSADVNCETKFAGRVAGQVNIVYQWKITDPIAFIQSAKSITSSATDSDHKIDPNALEGVENAVVDKMLVDLVREYTPNKEAGLDEKTIETDINQAASSKFANRGVSLYNMSVNVNFSPQTEEALDVISALKFYEQNGQLEIGKRVIEAKAGATKVYIQSANQKE